jgi:hypothetical protein
VATPAKIPSWLREIFYNAVPISDAGNSKLREYGEVVPTTGCIQTSFSLVNLKKFEIKMDNFYRNSN